MDYLMMHEGGLKWRDVWTESVLWRGGADEQMDGWMH